MSSVDDVVSSVDDVVNGIRQIQQNAMDAKATIVHHCDRADVLAVIIDRADSLASAIEASAPALRHQLAEQLTELVTPRNVGGPIGIDPYPGSVTDVADEIAAFIDQLDTSRSANGLRALVLERLRAMETEHMRKHYEVLLSQVLRTITAEHLHPALRDAGVPNPEGFRIELRGEWKP